MGRPANQDEETRRNDLRKYNIIKLIKLIHKLIEQGMQ